MLVVHGIDDVDEGLVSIEETVPASEHIAFEPAFERVFAEHLHHAAIGSDIGAVGILRLDLRQPGFQAGFVNVLQAVGSIFVRTEQTKAVHVVPHDIPQKLA